ncbi:MAG: dCMP deaminase family protein [Deltaproteobacteria bacterium]|nr:dCMP deaminase family protein [Deltaproteobacteria bacterium]
MSLNFQDTLPPKNTHSRLIPRPNWHEYFLAMAKVVSTRSTCSSRPVGCVITRDNRILVTGYNGAPPGEPHCTDQRAPDGGPYCQRRAHKIPDGLKLNFCPSLHAEANALELADRLGIGDLLKGSTLYTTLSPCIKCTLNLKNHGIAKVYYELAYNSIDIQRDKEWEQLAKLSFEVYEQINISTQSLEKILASILDTTSERLLPSS